MNPPSSPSYLLENLGPRFAEFQQQLTRPLLFLDTETTGTDPINDRIIEISIIRIMPPPGEIEGPRTWRINPGVKIPLEATEVHGISDADVADQPSFADVAAVLSELFRDADVAGFNVARFDMRVLQAEYARIAKPLDLSGMRVVDAQVIYHQKEPRNLAAALQFYRQKELEGAHGAQADAIAAMEVFAGQLARYEDLTTDINALHMLSTATNHSFVDSGRRFAWRNNEPVFNFGKLKGKSLRWAASEPTERAYLRWMLQGNFEEDTKKIVSEALDGRIRNRSNQQASEAPQASPSI